MPSCRALELPPSRVVVVTHVESARQRRSLREAHTGGEASQPPSVDVRCETVRFQREDGYGTNGIVWRDNYLPKLSHFGQIDTRSTRRDQPETRCLLVAPNSILNTSELWSRPESKLSRAAL